MKCYLHNLSNRDPNVLRHSQTNILQQKWLYGYKLYGYYKDDHNKPILVGIQVPKLTSVTLPNTKGPKIPQHCKKRQEGPQHKPQPVKEVLQFQGSFLTHHTFTPTFFYKISEIKLCNICFESATFRPSALQLL